MPQQDLHSSKSRPAARRLSLTRDFNDQAFYNFYYKTFSLFRAESWDLKQQAFRLRYRVYCEENSYIDPALNPGGIEHDAYDGRAAHFVLFHNESQKVAGAVRVIVPDADAPLRSFPLQELCDHPLLHDESRVRGFCEISRFCMSASFRKRGRDGRLLPAYYPQDDQRMEKNGNVFFIRRHIPYAPLGLFRAAFEFALERRIMDCVCLMEPDQLPGFKTMGINYRALGPRLKTPGNLQPVIFNIKNVLDKMIIENPACWDIVSDTGRLHSAANILQIYNWEDNILDTDCREEIIRQQG